MPASIRSILVFGLFALGCALGRSSSAEAQNRADQDLARNFFEQGIAFGDEDQWAEALEAFQQSRALMDRASTLFNIANALYRLGRPVDAKAALAEYIVRPDVATDPDQVASGTRLLALVSQSIATLHLSVAPDDARVELDAVPIASTRGGWHVELNPGSHVLSIHAEGFATRQLAFSIRPGGVDTREVRLEPIAPPPAAAPAPAVPAPAPAVLSAPALPDPHQAAVHAVEPARPNAGLDQSISPTPRVRESPEDDSGGIFSSPVFWIVTGVLAAAGGTVLALYLTADEGVEAPLQVGDGSVVEALRWP